VAVEELAHQVRALIVAAEEYQYAFARRVGIGMRDASALGHLFHTGPQNPSQIAARLNLTPASVTALADRLDAAGYVSRTPHPHDRRQSVLTLTPAGIELMNDSFAAFTADIGDAVADEPAGEVRATGVLLERIAVGLRARLAKSGQGRRVRTPARGSGR
jgi:DNA-binding MarR family transcriptional regulator